MICFIFYSLISLNLKTFYTHNLKSTLKLFIFLPGNQQFSPSSPDSVYFIIQHPAQKYEPIFMHFPITKKPIALPARFLRSEGKCDGLCRSFPKVSYREYFFIFSRAYQLYVLTYIDRHNERICSFAPEKNT